MIFRRSKPGAPPPQAAPSSSSSASTGIDTAPAVDAAAVDTAPDPAPDAADIDELRELMRHNVIDPELGVNIVDLGLVYDIAVVNRVAQVTMTLTTPGCPLSGYMTDAIQRTLPGRPGVDDTSVDIVWEPPWSPNAMTDAAKAALGWMG